LVNIRIVATADNEKEIEAVQRFARQVGADVFSVKSVSLYYDDDPEDLRLPKDRQYRSYQYQGVQEAAVYKQMPNTCRKPWAWPTLRYDGTLLICECDHQMQAPLGNGFCLLLSREGLDGGKNAAELRKHFKANGQIDLDFCKRCRYKKDDAIRVVERY